TLSTQMPSSLFYHRSTATFSFIFQNSPTTAIYTLSHTTLFRSLLDLGHARLDLPSTGEAARRLVVVGIEHVRHRGGEHDLAHRSLLPPSTVRSAYRGGSAGPAIRRGGGSDSRRPSSPRGKITTEAPTPRPRAPRMRRYTGTRPATSTRPASPP